VFIAGFPAGALAANCYVVATAAGGGCIVVDPGEEAGPALAELLRRHRLEPLAAVLTHGHIDHAASLALVTAEYRIPGYVHPADQYMLDDPLAALSPEFQQVLAGYALPQMRPADLRPLTAGPLGVGDLGVEILATPGHTGGSVVVRVPGDDDGPAVLLTGDTLFAGSVGRTDLPGGSWDVLTATLGALLEESDDTLVLPGHGPQTTIGVERRTNPFLVGLRAAASAGNGSQEGRAGGSGSGRA
jgi:hydroxyacylglutathione hydrolase